MKKLSYRLDIDGLRAIAVLLVVIFHFNLVPGGKAGFIGVDIFFVISGFLITSIILSALDASTFSFKTFYLSRIRRLAPALFVTLLLVMMAGSWFLFPADLQELAKQSFVSQSYVANFYYWRSINYFGLQTEDVYLLHTWSLAVEEQFYLVFPVAIFLAHRYFKKYLWIAVAVALVLSLILNLVFVTDKPEATFYLLPTRAWELLIGSFVFYLNSKFLRGRNVDEVLGLLGVVLIAVAVMSFNETVRFPGYFALLPTLGAAFLILSGSGNGTTTSWALSYSPLVYIGKISYPLYLVHWPINVFAKQILEEDYVLPWRFAMTVLAVLLAMAIYHLIENPVRLRLFLAGDRRFTFAYIFGLSVTAFLAVVVLRTNGLPLRFPDEVIRLADYARDRTADLPDCEFTGKPLTRSEHFCRIGTKGTPPEWLVYGDSHAWAAYGAFDQWLADRGQGGLFMFRNSCPPIRGIHLFRDKGHCFAFNEAVHKFLERQSSVRNVLLVSTWRQASEAGLTTSSSVRFSRAESLNLFEVQMSSTVQHLNQLEKQVYIWEPVPGAQSNVPLSLAKMALTKKVVPLEFQIEQYRSDFEYFFKFIGTNRSIIAQTFSPSAMLCQLGSCRVVVDGNPVYFDNDHVTRSSSDLWVRMLHRQYSESATIKNLQP